MALKKRDSGFSRPTRGQMRTSAKNGPKQGGGPPLFKLPEGMELFDVKKSGTVRLDFVGYVVREENHPERIAKKQLWPKRMFRVHNTPMGKIICAKSVDPSRKCRWCKKFFELKKECDENEELNDKQKEKILKPFKGQTWEGFFIVNPKNPKKVMFYPTSYGKFPKKLNEVCETTSQKNLIYFDYNTDGKTLKCAFNKKTFNGSQFFECVNIEFKAREELDQAKLLPQTCDIASLLNVLEDETLKKIYYQNDEKDDEDRPGKSFNKKSSKSRDDEDDDDSDEEDSDEKPRRKKKGTMAKDKSKKSKKSKKSDDEEDDEKPSKKSSKKKGKVKKKAKSDDDDEDEEPEEDEDEDEKPKKKKGKKKSSKKSKKDDDEDDDSDDDEEE